MSERKDRDRGSDINGGINSVLCVSEGERERERERERTTGKRGK